MAEETTALRNPESTWEYAISAADLLTIWRSQEVPALANDPLRTDVVVLIGTALYAWSRAARVEGAAVIEAPLARLLDMYLEFGPWFSACPAPPGMGKEQKDDLVLDFDRMAIARYAAMDVLSAHLRAAADPAVTARRRIAPARTAPS